MGTPRDDCGTRALDFGRRERIDVRREPRAHDVPPGTLGRASSALGGTSSTHSRPPRALGGSPSTHCRPPRTHVVTSSAFVRPPRTLGGTPSAHCRSPRALGGTPRHQERTLFDLGVTPSILGVAPVPSCMAASTPTEQGSSGDLHPRDFTHFRSCRFVRPGTPRSRFPLVKPRRLRTNRRPSPKTGHRAPRYGVQP